MFVGRASDLTCGYDRSHIPLYNLFYQDHCVVHLYSPVIERSRIYSIDKKCGLAFYTNVSWDEQTPITKRKTILSCMKHALSSGM